MSKEIYAETAYMGHSQRYALSAGVLHTGEPGYLLTWEVRIFRGFDDPRLLRGLGDGPPAVRGQRWIPDAGMCQEGWEDRCREYVTEAKNAAEAATRELHK